MTTSPYLSHSDRPFLCESVVVEVEDAESAVVLHGCGQRRHTGMVDAVLGHVDFLQASHQLQRKSWTQFVCSYSETTVVSKFGQII